MIRLRRRTFLGGLLAVALLLVVGRVVSTLYVNDVWYRTLNASAVWRAQVLNTVLLTGGIALANSVFLFANLYAVRRSMVSVVIPRRYLLLATLCVALVVGVVLALPPEPWTTLVLARHGITLPLARALCVRLLTLLLITTGTVVLLYFVLTPSFRWNSRGLTIPLRIRWHLAVLSAFFVAAVVWSFRLNGYRRGTSSRDHPAPTPIGFTRRQSVPESDLTPLPVLLYDSADGYALVSDSADQIAAPPIRDWTARLAHAWNAQRLGLLFAHLPSPNPKILEIRGVRERVDALTPFFTQGSVLWPVVVGDSLFWAVDLYSGPHAAIAFVHAYTGRVTILPDSTLDPVACLWVRCFPTLFTLRSKVPDALKDAAPPRIDSAHWSLALGPEAFRAQVEVLYDSMHAALSRRDLAAFGKAYESLGTLLGRKP